MQSPLSFGGFGALTRHLSRLTCAFSEALQDDCLSRANLRLINGYQPNLAATWLFQRSMGVPVGKGRCDPHLINRILTMNFRAFQHLGESVLKPFLQGQTHTPTLVAAFHVQQHAGGTIVCNGQPVLCAQCSLPQSSPWCLAAPIAFTSNLCSSLRVGMCVQTWCSSCL